MTSKTFVPGVTVIDSPWLQDVNDFIYNGDTSTLPSGNKLYNRINDSVSVKDFGAVGDGVADDTTAINTAISAMNPIGGMLYFPPGTYRTTAEILFNVSTLKLQGASEQSVVILVDHTGIGINVATNNRPCLYSMTIRRATIGVRGSRTGTGLRVFGDFGAGSSVQLNCSDVTIDGFSKNMDMYACFLSTFSNVTNKRCDVTYNLNNNTNDSIVFINCKSNNDIKQHIVGEGGAAECGASFVNCEFENGHKFPAIAVNSGTTFFLNFTNCYNYENNTGVDAGSTFNFIELAIAGKLAITGGGISSSGKDDARLIYGRRNASVGRWEIAISNTRLVSRRSTGLDVDVDFVETGNDTCMISPSCNYYNTLNPNCEISLGSGSLWKANPNILFRTRTGIINLANSTNMLQGTAVGTVSNAGASEHWQNNVLVFAAINGTDYTSLWPDNTGKWRTKHGSSLAAVTPASNTDGTIVGTQT